MPRPDNLDPEFLKEWEEWKKKILESVPPNMAHLYANPLVRDKLLEINLAGNWLQNELVKLGVEEPKIQRLCLAFGQKSMMSPDVWTLAQKTLEVFMKGYNRALENAAEQKKAEVEPEINYEYGFTDEERKALWERYTRVHPN